MVSARDCSTVLRRFSGPEAAELAILCRPDASTRDPVAEAEAAYRALADTLAAERSSFRDVASESIFLRDIAHDLPLVLDARSRVLSDRGGNAPVPCFIQQAPADDAARFVLFASAVVPHDRSAWSVRDVRAASTCACEGCARSGARLVRLGDQVSLHSTNLYGAGTDVHEQALGMFHAAERLLAGCDMSFRDVVRAWIQLRDIDRDYDALNAARREFFARSGVEQRPASTGVGGGPLPDAHACVLTVQAVKSGRSLDVSRMSTPFLNEAWSYGADFSRGLRVVEANRITLHVSGTASIDDAGRSVHTGDFAAQAERMLDNIESLLAGQGATFADLMSGVTYVKRADDASLLRDLYRRRGFAGFPCAVVEAALCRPELLCETEVVAMLPPIPPGA